MAARDGGVRSSEMAGIQDETAALDFDLACAIRLNQYSIERDELRAKLIAYEVSKLFGSSDADDDDF